MCEPTALMKAPDHEDPVVALLVERLEEQAERTPHDDAVQHALDRVRRRGQAFVQSETLTTASFFFGNVNFGFTAFLLGFWPQHFWVWQLCKCAMLLCMIVPRRRAANKELFLLEFCWVMNFLSVGLVAACALAPFFPPLHAFVNHPVTFLVVFGIANGPLGWAVAMLPSAFVMHDIDNMAFLFIHLSPAVLTWTFRWFNADVVAAYPSRFNAMRPDTAAAVTVADVVVPAATVYVVWMVLYCAWLLIWGIHHSPHTTGKSTTWSVQCTQKGSPLPMLLCYRSGETAELLLNRPRALQFQVTQCALAIVAMVASAPMWHSFALHTGFLVSIILIAIYRGAVKTHRSMMRWYMEPFAVLQAAQSRAGEPVCKVVEVRV